MLDASALRAGFGTDPASCHRNAAVGALSACVVAARAIRSIIAPRSRSPFSPSIQPVCPAPARTPLPPQSRHSPEPAHVSQAPSAVLLKFLSTLLLAKAVALLSSCGGKASVRCRVRQNHRRRLAYSSVSPLGRRYSAAIIWSYAAYVAVLASRAAMVPWSAGKSGRCRAASSKRSQAACMAVSVRFARFGFWSATSGTGVVSGCRASGWGLTPRTERRPGHRRGH